jgi:hypothetical protein
VKRALIPLGFLVVVAGCECGPVTGHSVGEPVIVESDPDAGERLTRDGELDFGPVFFGQLATHAVRVRNVGRGPLSLQAVERSVDAGVFDERSGIFGSSFDTGVTIGPSEELDVSLTFLPPVPFDAAVKSVSWSAYRKLVFAGASDEQNLLVHLKGRGVTDACGVPETLDFGFVTPGQTVTLEFELRNPTELAVNAAVRPIYSGSGDDLSFSFAGAVGEFPLAPGANTRVTVQFKPTQLKSYMAFFHTRAAEHCPERVVTLLGQG